MNLPKIKPEPDNKRFVQTIRGEIKPNRPPFCELFLDQEHMIAICEEGLGRTWVPMLDDRESRERYWDNVIAVYYALGYDYIRALGVPLSFPGKRRQADAPGRDGKLRSWTEEDAGVITTRREYEEYEWPEFDERSICDFEYISTHLPEGMGIVMCPSSGFLEVPMNQLLGYTSMCYLLEDDPELVTDVFDAVGRRILDYYKKIVSLKIPNLFGFFQGDDMGYKSATLISPKDMSRLALKWHKRLARLAHDNDMVYMLHSCGNLEEIMEELIDDVKIDAKHSFEDEIMPVTDFHMKYGDRICVLGGIDVDKMCRYEPAELRAYIRGTLDCCMPRGRYALGSGNSVTNYIPLQSYFLMLEEGWNYGK